MTASAVRILPLFATPLWSVVVDGHEALDREIRSTIIAKRETFRGTQLSNVHGWQSSADMLRWGGEEAAALSAIVRRMANAAVVPVHGRAETDVSWRVEMWANVNDRGASNQSHWHPGSVLSAVYYVDDGWAGSTGDQSGGELVFVDPRMPFLRMRSPDLHRCDADGSFSSQEVWIRPTSGLLVLFPSYLLHSVRPHGGAGPRITVAINLLESPA